MPFISFFVWLLWLGLPELCWIEEGKNTLILFLWSLLSGFGGEIASSGGPARKSQASSDFFYRCTCSTLCVLFGREFWRLSAISQSCKARGGAKSRWPPYSGWSKGAVDFLGSVLHGWGSPAPPHPLLYMLKTWWAGLASLAPNSAALCKLKHGKLKLFLLLYSLPLLLVFLLQCSVGTLLDSWTPTKVLLSMHRWSHSLFSGGWW